MIMKTICKNPAYVYLKGNAILQINGQIINLNEMHYYFVLPSICIKDLKIKRIDAKQVMTIENLTSFHDVSPNTFSENLLKEISSF